MKREFVNYPKGVRWKWVEKGSACEFAYCPADMCRKFATFISLSSGNERIPSTASHGNILESINITLNLLHLHYVDRDLHRTGNSIVVITSGNGWVPLGIFIVVYWCNITAFHAGYLRLIKILQVLLSRCVQ
jgi:hypothetical protein